ncbi:LOW QUALITY PROTEIN: uncharacterized protein K02A2.6-like, partial [Heteronotia binoei]|uniref:LOW QUALITY PROTEIN: uncharacterized protein K02A2.6-like n=1 Tax=Heteronotia binoei TaxID=13085 RepID=UPI00292EDCA9
CILWGSRVVVPPLLQKRVLESLHESHPGIVWMKALARSYVWWPGMDEEIENWVRRCSVCQESRPEPPSAPVTRWETTRKPWSRLHLDFAGPFQGQIFLIMVDAYTKWLEVIPVASTSSAAAIRALRRALSTHGIPDTIVTDNGAAFTSGEFQAFLQRYLIRHIRSAPFHPATNGQAERMVRTTKEALGRIVQGDWDRRLAAFLFDNRVTPNPVTGVSPAELLMGRKLITRLDRLHPDRASDIQGSPEVQEAAQGFFAGDPVFARNYAQGPMWVAGRVRQVIGTRHYEVSTEGDQTLRQHTDQLRRRTLPEVPTDVEEAVPGGEPARGLPEATAPAPTLPTSKLPRPAEAERPTEIDQQPTAASAPGETPAAEAAPTPQSSFHPGHGMETALVTLMDELCRKLNRGGSALLLLLGLTAEFNMVNHDLLTHHLATTGVCGVVSKVKGKE